MNKKLKNIPSSASWKMIKRILITSVIAILVCTNIWLFIEFLQHDTKITQQQQVISAVSAEREAVNDQLSEVKNEFETVKTENKGLVNRLATKDAEIKAKVEEIQRLIANGGGEELKKAHQEIRELRKLKEHYMEAVNTVNNENQKLQTEKQELTSNLEDARSKTHELEEKNTALKGKLAVGSILKAVNFIIKPVKFKENGKEVEVNKAAKLEKLKICFTILENLIVDKGVKDVYVRVLNPDGNTINGGIENILFKGSKLNYSVMQPLSYNNKDTDYCFYWNYNRPFQPGNYYAELYCEGNQLAVSHFILK